MAPIWVFLIACLVILLLAIAGWYWYVRSVLHLWIHALVSKTDVHLMELARQVHFEKIPHDVISTNVDLIIKASKAGVRVDTAKLDNFRQAGGNLDRVIQAMISASKANINLTLDHATAIELAGLDVLEAVRIRIRPVVVDTKEVAAKAQDGIELKVYCRITLRANLDNYIGGADVDAILARVEGGIGSVIGKSKTYREILENPRIVSDYIMSSDRDSDEVADVHQFTAFEVLSVDIADVNLGENIAARLEAERAEADAYTAKAHAEEERARAVELEERMKARVNEMRAMLIEAEAQVPIALAEAIRKGNIE